MTGFWRPTTATVDLTAISANVVAFARLVDPAMVCAVVKADGYGHGAVPCAQAALAAGAAWLGVATVEEAVELREAEIDAPILVLSEFPDSGVRAIVDHAITPTVYSASKIKLLESAVPEGAVVRVHIKVDTGMHRVGVQPDEAGDLARLVARSPRLELGGVFTHFAVADDPGNPYTQQQLRRFEGVLTQLAGAGITPGIVHASNSAGALAHPDARFDMVRVGVSLYGHDPDAVMRAEDFGVTLRPAMQLRSAVSHVKILESGDRVSYGLRYTFGRTSVVATVPIGYADGLQRRYSSVGGEVLIGGRRRPIAGRITMDQIVIDCGPPDPLAPVNPGDEVVLIGNQGEESISAWEMAGKLDTIAYEVTCGISKRVPRLYPGGASSIGATS